MSSARIRQWKARYMPRGTFPRSCTTTTHMRPLPLALRIPTLAPRSPTLPPAHAHTMLPRSRCARDPVTSTVQYRHSGAHSNRPRSEIPSIREKRSRQSRSGRDGRSEPKEQQKDQTATSGAPHHQRPLHSIRPQDNGTHRVRLRTAPSPPPFEFILSRHTRARSISDTRRAIQLLSFVVSFVSHSSRITAPQHST